MSTSDKRTDFDQWLVEEFAETGSFTVFAVLVEIGEIKVTPLRSTFFNVIGDEVDWGEITAMFAGSGVAWDGAAFFPHVGPHDGLLDNAAARLHLRELEARLDEDPLVLNEGQFFDKWGRRLRVDEVEIQ